MTIRFIQKCWEGPVQQQLFRKDIDDGQHKRMTGRQLWDTRDEYKQFECQMFSQHIHQEVCYQEWINYIRDKQAGKI